MRALVVLTVLAGCSEYDVSTLAETEMGAPDTASEDDCVEEVPGFDITEVSNLEDAVSFYLSGANRDAVSLSFDASALETDQTWRVSAVDVLVLIPASEFQSFEDGREIGVEVFDGSDPRTATSYQLKLPVVRADHNWDAYTLPYGPAEANERDQQGTWMRFDLRDVIPEEGMASENFVAGVRWPNQGRVAVGFSNYNRACNQNWTEYGNNTGWVLNGDSNSSNGCSWPMLRVQIETRLPDGCGE
jgi:hypothetical protein